MHTHDKNEFKFVNKKILKGEVHNNTYFFNQRSIENHGLIYKTNRAVYSTADKLDTVVSGFSVYAGYKSVAGAVALLTGQAASIWATGGWALLCYFQVKFLMQAYLSNVFLVDEIYITPAKDEIRVRTVLAGSSTNLFAQIRLNFVDKNTVKKEYVIPIKECSYAESNNDEDMIMRLQLGP